MSFTLKELERRRAELLKEHAKIEKHIAKEEEKVAEAAKQNSPDWVDINGVRIRIHGGYTSTIETYPSIDEYEYKPATSSPSIAWEATEPIDTMKACMGRGRPSAGGAKLLVAAHIEGVDYPPVSYAMTYEWDKATKLRLDAHDFAITFKYDPDANTIRVVDVTREVHDDE